MVLIRVFSTALVACLVARVAGAQAELSEAERLEFANGLFARGMYELAAAEYEAFLRDVPGSGSEDVVRFRLGESLRELGRVERAAEEFRRVFEKYPGSAYRFKAGFKAALLLREGGKYKEASEMLDRLLKAGPPEDTAAACQYELGEVWFSLGKPDESAKVFEELLKKHPNAELVPYAALRLGQFAAERALKSAADHGTSPPAAEMDRVAAYYKIALANGKTERVKAEALFQLADFYFRSGQYKQSFEYYRQLARDHASDFRTAESALQAAWAAYRAGLAVETLAIASRVLKEESSGSAEEEWLYLKANAERELGQFDAAVETYNRFLARYPKSARVSVARYEKALALYKKGAFKEAIAEAAKVPAEGEMRKDLYWLLAESYAGLDDYPNAIQYYRVLIRDFPKGEVTCEAGFRLAYCLQKQGELLEAARWYNTAAAECPRGKLAARALFASATCLAKAGNYEEALRDWSSLIRYYGSDPLVEEALYQKAMAQIRLKRDDEALASLGELVERFPGSRFAAESWYWQGVLLREAGRLQDAEQKLRKALDLKPREEIEREARYHLAIVLQKLGKHAEAAELFHSLLASPLKERFSPQLLEWLSTERFEKKQFGQAIGAATLLVEKAPDASWRQIGYYLQGRGYQAQGEKDKAIAAFSRALEEKAATSVAPESALRLAEVLLDSGRAAEAEEAFEKAAKMSAADEFLGIRARAYAGLGRSAMARGHLEKAARYFMSVAVLYDDPTLVPECLYEAAKILDSLSKHEEARKVREELQQRYPQSEWSRKVRSGTATGK